MNVKELKNKLDRLPDDMEVVLDITGEESSMFKFVGINFVGEVKTALNEEFVVLSKYDLDIDL